jgi:hypothetical protein
MDSITKAELMAALYLVRVCPDKETAAQAAEDVFEAIAALRQMAK